MTTTTRSRTTPLLAGALALAAAALLGACRGEREDKPPRQFFPDMDDNPKWEPQGHSEFFADGRQMRVPPAGTIAFGRTRFVSDEAWAQPWMQARADLLREDTVYYTGKGADGAFVAKAPIAFTQADLERGRERFNIYCSACHNYTGDGQGMVGRQWAVPVPSYHDPKYSNPGADQGRDGYLFHVSRHGVEDGKRMPGYAHALSIEDSWRIVAYIRALQQSRAGELSDVPEAQRPAIERAWSEMPAAAPTAPAPQQTDPQQPTTTSPQTTPNPGGNK
jgi:mono/diheme cytochrome c family protein